MLRLLPSLAFGLLLIVGRPACADEAPASPPAAPPSAEQLSLQGFGASTPLCLEWTDGCVVCARGDTDVFHCSTPGIACQPGPIVCRKDKPK